ncbi:MAG: hypothetical protein ACOX3E_14265 [Desulfomonilia bacterium]
MNSLPMCTPEKIAIVLSCEQRLTDCQAKVSESHVFVNLAHFLAKERPVFAKVSQAIEMLFIFIMYFHSLTSFCDGMDIAL